MSWSSALTGLNSSVRDTFGEPATWTPSGSSAGVSIIVVPRHSQSQEETVNPNYVNLWVLSVDAPTIARGDIVAWSSINYMVIDADPDGGGGINLTLEKTS